MGFGEVKIDQVGRGGTLNTRNFQGFCHEASET